MISAQAFLLASALLLPNQVSQIDLPYVIRTNYGSSEIDRGEGSENKRKIHSAELLKMNPEALKTYAQGFNDNYEPNSVDGFRPSQIYTLARSIQDHRALAHRIMYDMSRLKTVAERQAYLDKMIRRLERRIDSLRYQIAATPSLSEHILSDGGVSRLFFAPTPEERESIRTYLGKVNPLRDKLGSYQRFVSFLKSWRVIPEVGPRP